MINYIYFVFVQKLLQQKCQKISDILDFLQAKFLHILESMKAFFIKGNLNQFCFHTITFKQFWELTADPLA